MGEIEIEDGSAVRLLAAWDAEIESMNLALGRLRMALETSGNDTELHEDNQAEANAVGYRWRAYREARPELARLYREYSHSMAIELRQRKASVRSADRATGLAVWCGILGTVLVLAGLGMHLWWWVVLAGILLWVGCGVAVMISLSAGRSAPDAGRAMHLTVRIDTIERACEGCWTLEGLDAVRRLIGPQQAATGTELVRPTR